MGFSYNYIYECNDDYGYPYDCVYDYDILSNKTMIMTMVDIKKIMYSISMFATKTISLICNFPLKIDAFHYFAY